MELLRVPHGPGGLGIAALVVLMFLAVAAGAWPVVRRLTRRLEALKRGVETFGGGALAHRVDESGRDEEQAGDGRSHGFSFAKNRRSRALIHEKRRPSSSGGGC